MLTNKKVKEEMPKEQKRLTALDLFRSKKRQLERKEAKFGAEGIIEKGIVETSQLTIFTKEIGIKNAEKEEKLRMEKAAIELEEKKKAAAVSEKLKKYGKQKLIKNNVLQKLREVHS